MIAWPFPGILEFSGAIKGLMEIKGPLLASHGFATLSLAFYGYDDLPKSTKNLDCSYFEEAAEWLSSQAQVSQGGIGVMTVSSGSQFLFMLAIHRKDLIKAIVVISPLHCFAIMGCHYKGEKFPFIEVDHKRHWRTEKGYIVIKDTVVFDSPMNRDDSRAILPVEHIECPILLIYGEADLTVPVEYMTKRIVDRLKAHGKGEQCTVLRYPGAGHMIDPPYHPLCEGARFEYTGGEICAWGGETRGHAMAQEDSWAKIQSFFQRHLQITSCL